MANTLQQSNQSLPQGRCHLCGSANPESLRALDSPFSHGIFDYSQDALAKARHIVEDGQTKVHTLDQAIQQLQEHRDQIHRVVLEHQAFLPPIARLPDDVMLLVFDDAMGWVWEPEDGTLWAATAVCRRWRSLALSSRRLWSRIALDLEATAVTEERALLACQRAQLQLDRSNQELLEYTLNLEGFEKFNHPYIHASMQRLISSLDRCTSLEIGFQTRPSAQALAAFSPPSSLANLRDFIVRAWLSSTYAANLDSSWLATTPALQDVLLSSSRLPIADDPVPQFFRGITVLKMHRCQAFPAEVVAVLCATASLQNLTLQNIFAPPGLRLLYIDGTPPTIGQVANLPALEYLEVHFQPLTVAGNNAPPGDSNATYLTREVVRHIRTPRIGTLRLIAPDEEDLLAIQTCISEPAGSAASLTKLTLVEPEDRSIPKLPILLPRCPALGYLQILRSRRSNAENITGNMDPLLDALKWTRGAPNTLAEGTEDEETPRFCPELWKLWLRRCTMSLKTMKEMLASRRKTLDSAVSNSGHFDLPSKLLTEVYLDDPYYLDQVQHEKAREMHSEFWAGDVFLEQM